MIVRSCHCCRTCGQGHTLRLGMGQEVAHTYRFPCTECGEDMAVTLHVDYEKIEHWVAEAENAEPIDETKECRVVNLHANFVIPEEYRHQDMAFPHLETVAAMATKIMGARGGSGNLDSGMSGSPA